MAGYLLLSCNYGLPKRSYTEHHTCSRIARWNQCSIDEYASGVFEIEYLQKRGDMMSGEFLKIHNLKVVYSADGQIVHAINNISLNMKKGETLGLVGETGAGKTTLALTLLKLLPKQNGRILEGSILFQGHDLIQATEADMRLIRGSQISMIFQDPMSSLNPVLTVGEQIAEAIKLHMDLPKDQVEKRVEDMLQLVGIMASRKNDYPHQFSGGMKQRVVIAIALACEPDLLLADEPTTALDVTIQAQILDMMQELKDKIQTSILLITHDLGIVAEFCDKVAIMYAGEIVEYGTAKDIYEGTFNHPYTEGLFGSIPNIYSTTERLNPIEGLMPDPTNLPSGCKFHPRCPKCMDICQSEQPLFYRNQEHAIQCHFYAHREVREE